MNQDLTAIIFVLDDSGSMKKRRDETLIGFNAFLATQKAQPGQAVMTLITFDQRTVTHYASKPIQECDPLTQDDYTCEGSATNIYDAYGKAIDYSGSVFAEMPEAERPGKVVVVFLTDGEHNVYHTEYTQDEIKEMIAHQETVYNWSFVFMGAGIDANKQANAVGIQKTSGGILNITSAAPGAYNEAIRATAHNVSNYRSTSLRSDLAYSKAQEDSVK